MARMPRFRVRLYDIDSTDRGPDDLVALIEDPSDVGVSAYANEGGEMFFTIPQNHPAIDQVQPWLRHYEVQRLGSSGTYSTVGVGIIDDYDADENEVIVYGRDYVSLFDLSISGSQTSYTSQTYTSIITAEMSGAINQPGETDKSVTKFISLGTISSVSETTTVLTSYQPRLEFVRQLGEILASDDSTRPLLSVTRTAPFTLTWGANGGVDRDLILEYGANVSGFRFNPGLGNFATAIFAIGQKREGASLLFSNQSFAPKSTYGIIQQGTVFLDVVDQGALDRRTRRYARDAGTGDKNLALRIRSGAVSPVEFELADSFRVKVSRGLVNLDDRYTCWGWEWIGKKDGSEDLFLDLLPKRT